MSVPLRPEHATSRRDQFRQRRDAVRERVQLRRVRSRRAGSTADEPDPQSPMAGLPTESSPSLGSMLPGIAGGALAALVGLAALWGWQTWSNRVSEPIEDRIPILIAADLDGTDQTKSAEQARNVINDESLASTVPVGVSVAPHPDGAARSIEVAVASEQSNVFVIHVSGAVVQPGIVNVSGGARVIDALVAAGGATPDADLDRVNLAAVVMDGERIHIPAHGQESVPVIVAPSRSTVLGSGATRSDDSPALLLDINTANAESLEALPGVGPSIAQAIVQTRLDRGPFFTVDELLDVPGIGESKLAQIEPFVQIGS